MGSYKRATMMGFLCRLCSSYKNYVIHLYGQKATELALLDKIKILPVKVKKFDKLPKTVCEACVEKLCTQYEYMQKFFIHSQIIGCPLTEPHFGSSRLQLASSASQSSSDTSDEIVDSEQIDLRPNVAELSNNSPDIDVQERNS